MYIFRQITADKDGIVNAILYSTVYNEKIENKDKWLIYDIPVDERIPWDSQDPRIGELIIKVMQIVNGKL